MGTGSVPILTLKIWSTPAQLGLRVPWKQAPSKILYIKIQHIYATILQRSVYILIIWFFYTMSAVYKSG
jgi:hypothetical protein